ncbi:hypothetical protein HMPREF0972_00741 [Actinomyces sp. oral taxon 848 str. F0332]|nr:hypothetical protein HMPREF0972_00741 [Actinomyces sp. oral taxon 848 str. F0332]
MVFNCRWLVLYFSGWVMCLFPERELCLATPDGAQRDLDAR